MKNLAPVLLVLLVILVASLLQFSCKNKSSTKTNQPSIYQSQQQNIQNLEKAQEVFARAQTLLSQLDGEKDQYDLKRIFPQAQIIPATYNGNGWNFTPQGDAYIIFLLPATQADYDRGCGKPVVMGTQKGNFDGREFSLVIFNPKWLEISKSEIATDYLATSMLHEAVHMFQWFRTQRTGIELPSIEREKEAYLFQLKFLQMILDQNNIKEVKLPKGIKITNAEDIAKATEKIDIANGYNLGPVATLVLYQHHLASCLPFLTFE